MRKRKVTTLFAVSFLLVFGKQNAEAADSANYSTVSSDNKGDTFHYGFNHIYPENSELVYLRRMVNKMKKDPSLKLKITSHGCAIGTDDANMKVSRLRANILEDYMMRHDIPKSRLVKEWKGESEPIADNDSEYGRSINRRSLVQLIRESGEVSQGVNKPKKQVHSSSSNPIASTNNTRVYSSSNVGTFYSGSSNTSNSYIASSHNSSNNYSSSSYASSNLPGNIHSSNTIQQPKIHSGSSTHIQSSGNVYQPHSAYNSNRNYITSNNAAAISHLSTSTPVTSSHSAVSQHQNNVRQADPKLSQNNNITTHSANTLENKYYPISDNTPLATEPAKDYVEIDVEEIYQELNPDLEPKQGVDYQSANENRYNQLVDAFSPAADEEKYNQLANALSPDTDEEDALSFSEEVSSSSNKSNSSSILNPTNASSHKEDELISESFISNNETRKINQPKPKPILKLE